MGYVRRLLAGASGKVIAAALVLIVLVIAIQLIISHVNGDTPSSAFSTTYICTETGKPFRHTNRMGEVQPIRSPFSGRNTGVPAEACFWTADGGTRKDPTWVLLNDLAGRPGPTFCPDCGRLVVGHNPQPGPGVRVPPTAREHKPGGMSAR